MSLKLGGYRSNRENAGPSKYLQRSWPIIAESQFQLSKKSISIPFDTGVRGGRRIIRSL